MAPVITRFKARVRDFVSLLLKKLKGYHKDNAIPEYIRSDSRLSTILIFKKVP